MEAHEHPISSHVEEAILQLEIASSPTLTTITMESFWKIYNFPIIFILLYLTLIICYFILQPKQNRRLYFTILILVATLPLSFLATKIITDREPTNFSEVIKYEQKYNVFISTVIKTPDHFVYFIPSTAYSSNNKEITKNIANPQQKKSNELSKIFSSNKDVGTKILSNFIKSIYYNDSIFPDPLSNQNLNVCSIYFLVEPGHGELSNDQYLSFSWNKHELLQPCKETAYMLRKFINKDLELKTTNASIFTHDYPPNIYEFNVGISNDKTLNQLQDKDVAHEHVH